MKILAAFLLFTTCASAGPLFTRVVGLEQDDISGVHTCTATGTSYVGCNPAGYAASSVPESWAAFDSLKLRLPVSAYPTLGSLITNGLATAEGWASTDQSYTIAGYNGPGYAWIDLVVQTTAAVIGQCTADLQVSFGSLQTGSSSVCSGGIVEGLAPVSFGTPMELSVTLHGHTTTDGGAVFPLPQGGVQYTSVVDTTASFNNPLKLYFQPISWADPIPVLSIERGETSYLQFEQINLPPLVTPEPSSSSTFISTAVLLAIFWRVRSR